MSTFMTPVSMLLRLTAVRNVSLQVKMWNVYVAALFGERLLFDDQDCRAIVNVLWWRLPYFRLCIVEQLKDLIFVSGLICSV